MVALERYHIVSHDILHAKEVTQTVCGVDFRPFKRKRHLCEKGTPVFADPFGVTGVSVLLWGAHAPARTALQEIAYQLPVPSIPDSTT